MVDKELDALDIMADLQRLVDDEGDVLARASLQYITSLRAQVAAANARADRAEAERAAQLSPDVAELTEVEIAQIEAGGKRWHGEAAQSYRWEPYKPDGQRQMKAKGRWQRQVGSGDYWRWENCDRPTALSRVKGGAA